MSSIDNRWTALLAASARRVVRSPLAWILGCQAVLRLVGLGWGLPASVAWDKDGIAPRSFLSGLSQTFTPGTFYKYPPLHPALLFLATLPIPVWHTGWSIGPRALQGVQDVSYLTALCYGARLVSVGMSLVLVWTVAKITEEVRDKRAGWCAAAFLGVNTVLTYYAHTSNVDVPYLMWGALALLALVRAIGRREPRRLRHWAILAALCVGTKDQGYALFLFSVPAALVLWWAADGWARQNVGRVARECAVSAGLALGTLLVVDNVAFNSSGFVARLKYLANARTLDAAYSRDWGGRWRVLEDSVLGLGAYPAALGLLAAAGLAVFVSGARRSPAKTVAGLAPMLVSVSFICGFNMIAMRTGARFLLPLTVLTAVYGGIGVDALLFAFVRVETDHRFAAGAWTARAGVAAVFLWALYRAANVDANLVLDPRYDAERWLQDRLRREDTVETYGLDWTLLRFPADAHVVRILNDEDAVNLPKRIPNVTESADPYGGVNDRAPRYIVVQEGWAHRYLDSPRRPESGHVRSPKHNAFARESAARDYFRALFDGRYPHYSVAHVASWSSRIWSPVDMDGVLGRTVLVFERDASIPR